ncbi:MAG: thiolase family protein [Spirochaetales bacterium]|nr:thiolase family protein [Spirochaetales bacterium]
MRMGIIGHALTMEGQNDDWSVEDTVFYTVRQALESAGMEIGQVDTVVQAADDVLDGIAINHVQTIEAAGAFLKEESKVERDGAWALQYAMVRLLSGKFQTAMVVAFSKGSQSSLSAFSGLSADPFYLRPVGTDADSIAAIQAHYFCGRTGATEEDLARIAQKNRSAALANPRSMRGEGREISIEEILAAEPIATPINVLNSARVGDGCTVLLLATEDWIRQNQKKASFLTGVGFISDAYYPTYRDLSRLKSAELAMQAAARMAGLAPADVRLAEVHECYAHQELMLYEALGFCKEGEAVSFLNDGHSLPGGRLPVNPSGGVLGGNVIYAAGLTRVLECHLQLTGQAGAVQVKGADRAIAHAQAGLAMQANIAFVLES